MLYIIKILLLSMVMGIAACHEGQPAAETKFVALDQERGYWFGGPPFLIKKVHRPQLRIAYGFAGNNHCGNRFKGRYGEQLLNSVSASLRVWLGALAGQTNIVDNFVYELREVRLSSPVPSLGYGWFDAKPDLAIIFHCHRGRSFMRTNPFPTLHMLQATDISDHNRMTALRRYRASTLLHELGHAFGLGDTYVDSSRWARRVRMKRYNRSTGGTSTTTGEQPVSVMNHHRNVALDADGALQLTADDHDGMQWLYARYISKKTRRRSCPSDYRREHTTKGCVPIHAFIYAAKQRNWTVVRRILQDDKDIDINTQDKLGNTALHYAAQATDAKGSDLYPYLIDQGADDSIRNHQGDSAADLRQRHNAAGHSLVTTIVAEIQRGTLAYATWLLNYALRQHDTHTPKHVLHTINTSINACDIQETTLLQRAAIEGYTRMVAMLLQQPAIEINKQCGSGNTALHLAAVMGHVEVTKLLLAHRHIDARIKNVAGDTPHSLSLASIARHRSNIERRKRLEAVESLLSDYLDDCVRAPKLYCLSK